MSGHFTRAEKLSSWRKIALSTWSGAGDPSVYGVIELDVSRTLPWISAVRERTGVRLTLTHVVGKAIALAIAGRPDVNAIIRRGRRVYTRDTVDVFFQVAFEGGENLSGAKVEGADRKGVLEIARELEARAARVREKRDKDLQRTSTMLDRVPDRFIGPLMRSITFLTYDLGLDLRRVGIPYDQFGSVMVTNVGMFGLPVGFAPLVPFARTPILLTVGAVQDKPVAVDGRVQIRPVLTVGATFDHRILDGYQAGKLAARFKAVMEDPEGALDDEA